MEPAIEVKELSKKYGRLVAVDRLNLTVGRGTVHGFLGPNGAGKTTTIKVLMGLLKPDGGSVKMLGMEVHGDRPETRQKVGYMPELPRFPRHLKGRELLDIYGRIYGMTESARKEQLPRLLEMVGLKGREGDLIGKYSKGMQQRLGIAQALLNDPELVILDEPSLGLDPIGMVEVRDLVKGIAGQGMTIFMSSHLLNEVEQICDHATIIDHGKELVSGTLQSMTEVLSGTSEVEVEVTALTDEMVEAVREIPQVVDVSRSGNMLTLESKASDDIRPAVSREIMGHGGIIISMNTRGRGLEDVFVKLVAGKEKGRAT